MSGFRATSAMSGRTPEELARKFEPTAQSISTWVKQAERDAGKRVDGPRASSRMRSIVQAEKAHPTIRRDQASRTTAR